jgi:hypothetical protein
VGCRLRWILCGVAGLPSETRRRNVAFRSAADMDHRDDGRGGTDNGLAGLLMQRPTDLAAFAK